MLHNTNRQQLIIVVIYSAHLRPTQPITNDFSVAPNPQSYSRNTEEVTCIVHGCNKKYTGKYANLELLKHMNYKHLGQDSSSLRKFPPKNCDNCSQKIRPDRASQHKCIQSKDGSVECSNCKYSFASRSSLSSHKRSKNPSKCKKCNKTFTGICAKNAHLCIINTLTH